MRPNSRRTGNAQARSGRIRGGPCAGAAAFHWVWLALLLAVSCAPPPPKRAWDPARGYQELLAGPLARLEQLEDLTAEVQLTVQAGEERQRASAVLQLKNPDLMKLEVRGPFYSHMLTVVVLADSLYVHGRAAGGNWQGAVDGFLLEFLTGVDLGGYDLRYALLGLVEEAPVDTLRGVVYPRADRAIVPLVAGPGYTRRIWVDLHRGLVTREEVAASASHWRLVRQLRDYRRVSALLLPGVVEVLQQGRSIRLEYRRYRVNTGLTSETFKAALPRTQVRRLD